MDINTMLSAAYDAYEKVKAENAALMGKMTEMQKEIDGLNNQLKVVPAEIQEDCDGECDTCEPEPMKDIGGNIVGSPS